MIVKNSEFIQEFFPTQICDYMAECQGETIKENARIIGFPRDPKPHEVTHLQWVKEHWK